jgi:hypothetical protein
VRHLILPVLALAVAGCAWGPGAGFATLQKAEVTAALPLESTRRDEQGRWKTDNGYRLEVAEGLVRVYIGPVTLDGPGPATGAPTGAVFDPANPPPGYSLCHGGHCHRADGALIDYADIQAELSQGGVRPSRQFVMTLRPVDPVAFVPLGGEAKLDSFSCDAGGCDFPQATVDGAVVRITRLQAYGRVAAGAGVPDVGNVRWELDLDLGVLNQAVSLKSDVEHRVINREGVARLQLSGRLHVTERLFDGIQWERLAKAASGGTIHLGADDPTKETLAGNIARFGWQAQLQPWP